MNPCRPVPHQAICSTSSASQSRTGTASSRASTPSAGQPGGASSGDRAWRSRASPKGSRAQALVRKDARTHARTHALTPMSLLGTHISTPPLEDTHTHTHTHTHTFFIPTFYEKGDNSVIEQGNLTSPNHTHMKPLIRGRPSGTLFNSWNGGKLQYG